MSHLPPTIDLGFIAGLAVCGQAVRACSHRARPPCKGLGHIHAAGRERLVVCVDFFSQRHKVRRHAHGLHRPGEGLGGQIAVPGLVYAIVEDGSAHEEILSRDYPGGNGIRFKGKLSRNGVVRPVKEIVRVNAKLRDGHWMPPPQKGRLLARGDSLDRDAVQVLSEQGHTGDGEALRDGGGVVALGVEADQVAGLACGGVHQPSLGVVAVGGVNVVHHDVVHGGGNDLALCDLAVRQQEDGVVAHEILDVLEAVLVLDGDRGGAQVLRHVQDVGKAHNAGDGAVHVLELVLHAALCHGQSHLKGLGGALQAAGVQVLVELVRDLCGQVEQKLVVGLLHGHIIAIVLDCLQGDGLGVLFDCDLAVVLLLDGVLAVGDLLALCHGAALQGALGVLALQHGAGLHPNGAHDAHDLPQVLPVALEACHKVDFPGVDGNLGSGDQIGLRCHVLVLSAACKQVGICSNRGLALASVLDCKNLVFGHFGAGVGGRGVHICAGGGRSAYEVAPISFQAVGVLLGVLNLALIVQLQLVDILAGQPHDPICILVQNPCGFQQLPELGFLGCVGVLLGLLGLVVGQRLFSGFLAAVGCVAVFFGFGEGCVFFIELVLQSVRFLMQHVQNFLELAAGVCRFIFQNRPESFAFECHVIVLSALARAAMLGNKV
nr:MAG TPA: hypothetical protein [Caudoviricetes sp.]